MKDIYSYDIKILNGVGTDSAELPEKLRNKPSEPINDNDTSELMTRLLAEHEKGFVAVSTRKESVAALINALNMNFQYNRIIVICNGKVDASAVERELEEKSLTDRNGEIYYPVETEYSSIFHDGDRILLKTNSVLEEDALYTSNSEVFGTILDEKYHYSNILGTVDHYLEELTVKDKARLFKSLLTTAEVSCFSDILILKEKNGYLFITLPSAKDYGRDMHSLYLELFAGIHHRAEVGDTVIALAGANLPVPIADDVNRIVTNRLVSAKVKLPSAELMLNTMERLLIAE